MYLSAPNANIINISININVKTDSPIVTSSGDVTFKQMKSHTYANTENTPVVKNTPTMLIAFKPVEFGSLSSFSTAIIDIADITSKLKAADPTIVDGPISS